MYLPTKNISTHPRYVGSGVFGSIGKVLGKLASKVSGEAAKKLAKKAVSKAGEQASKAILKKTQAVADEKVAQLIDNVMKRAKPKPKPVTQQPTGIPKPPRSAVTQTPKPRPVTQPASTPSTSPEEIINKLIAGSGTTKPPRTPPRGGVLKLEDIINRGINTPFLPSPFTGSGIKTL